MNFFSSSHDNKHRPAPAPAKTTAGTGTRCPDMLSLVTFGDQAAVRSPLVSAFDAGLAGTVGKLDKITPGWTNIAAGLRVGVDLLSAAPRGLRRRLWLLSDGRANVDVAGIMPQVARARDAWININTIGFGDPNDYDEAAMRAISQGTHNGRFMSAHTAEKLHEVFRGVGRATRERFGKGEATCFVIDTSGSMFSEQMGGRPRIEVVKSAVFGLIAYKQANWS